MKKALIVVDVQNDFCPGGSLPVVGGSLIIPGINDLIDKSSYDYIIATLDFHPKGHISFASTHGKEPFETIILDEDRGIEQKLWPDHCVVETHGAALHPDLDTSNIDLMAAKGYRKNFDSYSAFYDSERRDTGLADFLRALEITKVHIVGIAFDVCVLSTALDASQEGFDTWVLKELCASVDIRNEQETLRKMYSNNITIW